MEAVSGGSTFYHAVRSDDRRPSIWIHSFALHYHYKCAATDASARLSGPSATVSVRGTGRTTAEQTKAWSSLRAEVVLWRRDFDTPPSMKGPIRPANCCCCLPVSCSSLCNDVAFRSFAEALPASVPNLAVSRTSFDCFPGHRSYGRYQFNDGGAATEI